MRPIRTANPKIIFYVNCEDSEIEEATKIANELAEKNSNVNYLAFSDINVLKQFLAVL